MFRLAVTLSRGFISNCPKQITRHISLTNPRQFIDIEEAKLTKDEDLYWDTLKSQLDAPQISPINHAKLSKDRSGKRVFVLQLRMQYKSKSRQSTTAELQLAESISLVRSLDGWSVCDSLIMSTKRSGSAALFGSGNQEVLSKRIGSSGCDALFVVIDRLTNLQVETLRKTWVGGDENLKIYDRYMIVLEIFKRNASSAIAKLQIALAEIPYMRHKYENTDLYKTVERNIRRELDLKLRTRAVINSQRRTKQIPTISVFGYTNVGKTSFIKALTCDAKMKPENKLFATLDVTYHGSKLSQSNQDIIFIDTIGFISDIPHNLVEAFRTSLQDAIHADLIIHLIDASHPDRDAQENTVDEILSELLREDKEKPKSIIKVYNKCDKIDVHDCLKGKDGFFISCKSGKGVIEMRNLIEERVCKEKGFIKLRLVVVQGSSEMAYLYKNSVVEDISENGENGQMVDMTVLINRVNALKLVKLFPKIRVSK